MKRLFMTQNTDDLAKVGESLQKETGWIYKRSSNNGPEFFITGGIVTEEATTSIHHWIDNPEEEFWKVGTGNWNPAHKGGLILSETYDIQHELLYFSKLRNDENGQDLIMRDVITVSRTDHPEDIRYFIAPDSRAVYGVNNISHPAVWVQFYGRTAGEPLLKETGWVRRVSLNTVGEYLRMYNAREFKPLYGVYEVTRHYGGPEEGGWTFENYEYLPKHSAELTNLADGLAPHMLNKDLVEDLFPAGDIRYMPEIFPRCHEYLGTPVYC